MCNHRGQQMCCLAAFSTYQFVRTYVWVLFILTSNDIAELMYCPQKVTGRVFNTCPYNHTNE